MGIRSLLAERLPNARTSDTLADRVSYAHDSRQRLLIERGEGRGPDPAELPSTVIWPTEREEVALLVDLARSEGLKLVPFGAGSGVSDGIAGDARSVIVDLKGMTKSELDPERPALRVGPGATGITLENELERRGFTIGHFPSSIICSTVGGWVAGRGAGQCSSRYGKIEDMVISAECVLGNGRVVRFQRRSGGLDLLPLIVGSEGALGVITDIELRLARTSDVRRFLTFRFARGVAGMAGLRSLMQHNLRPVVARLYDPVDTLLFHSSSRKRTPAARAAPYDPLSRLKRRAIQTVLARAPLLNSGVDLLETSPFGRWLMMVIFEGEGADEDAARASELLAREGGEALGEGPARAWYEHRYSVSFSQSPVFRAGAFNDTMEVAAPWSRLDELFKNVRSALGRHVLVLAHLSHAYPDGCSIYFTFGAARTGGDALATYDSAWRDALAAAHESGAAISHHHGIGRSKAAALEADLGPSAAVLRRVLSAWDPAQCMNPGALLPLSPAFPAAAASFPPAGLDATSELCVAHAADKLQALEARLNQANFTLGGAPPGELSVGEWLERGLPGAPDAWLDPADHVVAGLQARFSTGEELVLAPVPRRATGPDLSALFVGAGGEFGSIAAVALRVRKRDAPAVRGLPFAGERSPAPNQGELEALGELRATWARTR